MGKPFAGKIKRSSVSFCGAGAASAHRYHLLLLALLGQVLDAVDEKLVGADVGPASLDHPAAQLHQLEEGVKKKKKKWVKDKHKTN